MALLDKSHIISSQYMDKNFQYRFSRDEGLYNCKIKYYGDEFIKVTCFNKNIYNPDKLEKRVPKEALTKDNEKTKVNHKRMERNDSVKRAKDKVFEIAYANSFDFFITLTINREKLSRTDIVELYKKLKPFLSNLVQRNNLKYILIPEYHKNLDINGEKAIHLHGLISGISLDMVDSGKTYHGAPIYNWLQWKYGFSTAIKLNSQKNICQYITKYITKDSSKIFGKYYLSGGKLNRQVLTEYSRVDFESIDTKVYEVIPKALYVKYQTIDLT